VADLSESTIKGIVQQELSGIKNDLSRINSALSNLEGRMQEVRSIHNDVRQVMPDVARLLQQTKDACAVQAVMYRLAAGVEEVRQQVYKIEQCSTASSLYARQRMQERSERGYA
jgi:hypothetical protein